MWKMVDFGESDKMIKISGKVDSSNTINLLVIFHSLFTELFQAEHFFEFFNIVAIEDIDEIKKKIKEGKRKGS